jgi:phosphoglycerate dehydrogenase-like enzyme
LRIALLDDYQRVALDLADWSPVRALGTIDVFDRNLGGIEEAAEALRPYDVIGMMRERQPLPRALIERLPNLKLVIVTGARVRTIDFDATAERGITVCHTLPGGSHAATPELAWGLILATARHLPKECGNLRAGGWQQTLGTALSGSTLGLLGLGKLGRTMVPIARAFGMDCIAWSQNLTAERATEAGAILVSREELFARADFLSIHLVLSERSRGLVGEAELRSMKRSAILVNTSRGPIVDEDALIAALRERRIRGAGLDVFDREPLPTDHPFRQMDNVVATPHLGYVTEAAYREFYESMVDGIVAWSKGAPIRVLAAPAGSPADR